MPPIYESSTPKYRDRREAGKVLASRLSDYRDKAPIVLAIPNGGVPVAAVIAEELDAEIYLMIVRKLQIPDNPEAGFGALTFDGLVLLNRPLMANLGLTEEDISTQKEKALASIHSRQEFFGKDRPVTPSPKHIELAETRYGLGVADPKRIDIVRLGETKGMLI